MRSSKLRLVAVALVGALTVAACGAGGPDVAAPAPTDGPLLSGEFATLDGGSIDLAALEGQDVVLWFWAPW